MPVGTRSSETQSKIEFRTRKSCRNVPVKVENAKSLEVNESLREKRKLVRLGPSTIISPSVALQNSSRQLFVQVAKVNGDHSLSPLKSGKVATTNGSSSPRKRLFDDGKMPSIFRNNTLGSVCLC